MTRRRARDLLAPVLAGRKPEVVFETFMQGRGGREYPAEIWMQLFACEHPPILVAMAHDVSDRRRVGDAARPAAD